MTRGGGSRLFSDPLHDQFAGWATGYVTSGAADYGEILAIAGRMPPDGDDAAFHGVWSAAADSHLAAADDAERAGHPATARGHLLRAAAYHGVAIHALYGRPVDPRLVQGFERAGAAFGRAMALIDPPGEALALSFDGHDMPAWFVPAAGSRPGEARPLVICTGGYDCTMADTYLAMSPALERGYHCLLYDGPGQGGMLVHGGVPMVPEWERVVKVLVDAALQRPDVDPDRVALRGWSLGGHLVARAATGEHRLAAVVADPPFWGMAEQAQGFLAKLGIADPGTVASEWPDEVVARLTAVVAGDRVLTWQLVRRGLWVMGAADMRSLWEKLTSFTLDGQGEIRCPLLATAAENDPNARGADAFVARLTCPTTLIRFTAAEGAGDHCEMQNLWLLNARVLDWLDDTLGPGAPPTRAAAAT